MAALTISINPSFRSVQDQGGWSLKRPVLLEGVFAHGKGQNGMGFKIIVDLEEDLIRKRKIKSSTLSDSGKRRRTSIKSATSPSLENTSSSSSACNRSVSPAPASAQPSVPIGFVEVSQERDLEQDTFPRYSDTTHPGISVFVTSEEDTSILEGSFRDDAFPMAPPDLDETIRDEKIKRLKQVLRQQNAALEEMRREMQQS